MIGSFLLKKIGGKLVGKAVSAAFNPFKMYFLAVAVAAIMGAIGYYVVTSEVAKAKVPALEGQVFDLKNALSTAEAQIKHQNERIRAQNKKKREDMRLAAERVKAAEDAADVVAQEKEVIVEALAEANFAILESLQDGNEDLEDWIYEPVPLVVWEQLRRASEGDIHPE